VPKSRCGFLAQPEGPTPEEGRPVFTPWVSLREIPQPYPTPLREAVCQSSSTNLSALQQALPVKPQQVTVHRSAIGTRLEPGAYLVWSKKTPSVIENRQNFWFGHG